MLRPQKCAEVSTLDLFFLGGGGGFYSLVCWVVGRRGRVGDRRGGVGSTSGRGVAWVRG